MNTLKEDEMRLISGKTCGKCVMLERELVKQNIKYEKIYAEDNMPLCRENDIYKLPTLMIGNKLIMGLTECINYIKG